MDINLKIYAYPLHLNEWKVCIYSIHYSKTFAMLRPCFVHASFFRKKYFVQASLYCKTLFFWPHWSWVDSPHKGPVTWRKVPMPWCHHVLFVGIVAYKKKILAFTRIYWIKPFDWRNVECVAHAGAYKHALPTSKYIIPWLTYAVSAVNCYQVNKVPGGHFPVVNMQQMAVCHMQQLLMLDWIPFTGSRKQSATFMEHLH